MQLRNGKIIFSNNNVHETICDYDTDTDAPPVVDELLSLQLPEQNPKRALELEPHEKHVCASLSSMLNSIAGLNNMSKDERFSKKIELIRRLYQTIDTEKLITNPKFDKFTKVLLIKTKEHIRDIDFALTLPNSTYPNMSKIDRNNAISLRNEIIDTVYLS